MKNKNLKNTIKVLSFSTALVGCLGLAGLHTMFADTVNNEEVNLIQEQYKNQNIQSNNVNKNNETLKEAKDKAENVLSFLSGKLISAVNTRYFNLKMNQKIADKIQENIQHMFEVLDGIYSDNSSVDCSNKMFYQYLSMEIHNMINSASKFEVDWGTQMVEGNKSSDPNYEVILDDFRKESNKLALHYEGKPNGSIPFCNGRIHTIQNEQKGEQQINTFSEWLKRFDCLVGSYIDQPNTEVKPD